MMPHQIALMAVEMVVSAQRLAQISAWQGEVDSMAGIIPRRRLIWATGVTDVKTLERWCEYCGRRHDHGPLQLSNCRGCGAPI
jgi:hypothetical protein